MWFFLGAAGCAFLLAMGAYFQFVDGLEPCPLCISQRIAIAATGVAFLIAAIHNPTGVGRKVYAVIGAIVALIGASISIRHIWIQNLPPDQVPECGPGLEYVFENFPLTETIKMMLSGTGECAEIDWSLFGISMPGWTLVAFLMLAAWSLVQFWQWRIISVSSEQ
ncbi:MAG: disulfide bond formation protein B [Gammaproteobacteria bacterium]|nr:disulfide bond formation protein B [Gammaproteobacteria bacterium]